MTPPNTTNVTQEAADVLQPRNIQTRFRAPAFTPDDPDVWFQQVEWNFEDAGVTTSLEKFKAVARTLDHTYAREVRDLILNPPATQPYERLKEELLRRLCKSREHNIRKLLEREIIGDRTPSQFLRHLRELAGTTASDDIVKTLWTNQLNPLVQANLAARSDLDLGQQGEVADRIMDTLSSYQGPQPSHIAGVTQSAVSPSYASVFEQLSKLVVSINESQQELRREIAGINQRLGEHGKTDNRSRSKSRNRERSRKRSSTRENGMCWYHFRFAEKAQKCTFPCSFKSGNAMGGH